MGRKEDRRKSVRHERIALASIIVPLVTQLLMLAKAIIEWLSKD